MSVVSKVLSLGDVSIPSEESVELRYDGDPSVGPMRLRRLLIPSRAVDALEVERIRIGKETYLEGSVPARVFVGETPAERYARLEALAGQIRKLPRGFRCELCLRGSSDRDTIEHDEVCPFVGPEPMPLEAVVPAGASVAVTVRNVGPTEVRVAIGAICYAIAPGSSL